MGLFDIIKRMDIYEKTQYNLEQSQRNIDTYTQLMVTEHTALQEVKEEKEPTVSGRDEISPLMAAYALNLCTVSITQIIDYMDLNVMEQEYDMILNNLNLQNMPDDDALLDILKQILNTVTFFKIDQKEREFVEREYQQKMKNAVWSAVPNVGALIATGVSQGPAMMAVSLAASVGTAYMSYRKQKAENTSAYEKEMWQLEKSAIEQFDGLKRELFDTAWRLSKHFGFEDKYRLSERQIHQYNAILMDADNDRRYARLNSIKECFEAYPPFWYQFGHTAYLVAHDAHCQSVEAKMRLAELEEKRAKGEDLSNEVYEKFTRIQQDIKDFEKIKEDYLNKAKSHFEDFFEKNTYGLLREDKMAAMCNLEYVDLSFQIGKYNIEELKNRLAVAAKKAGNSLEVLQLCVFAYMKLGDLEKAEEYLKILVNEDYNAIMNAQILSSQYVHQLFSGEDVANARWNYSVLCKRVPSEYLFPMPTTSKADKQELERQFIYVQKFALLRKYERVLNSLTNKYATRFNRCFPKIEGFVYSESSFDDTYEARHRMKEQVMNFALHDKNETLITALAQKNIFEEYMQIIHEYFDKLCDLAGGKETAISKMEYEWLRQDVLEPLSKCKDEIGTFRLSIQKPDTKIEDIINGLFSKYTFMFFVKEMLVCYTENILTDKVKNICSMEEISKVESEIFQFCSDNNIEMPTEQYVVNYHIEDKKYNFLMAELIGNEEYEKLKAKNVLRESLLKCISDYCKNNKLIKRDNKSMLYIRGKDDEKLDYYLEHVTGYKAFRADVLAVIEERGLSNFFNDTDLWLTTEGIVIVKDDKFKLEYVSYDKVVFSDDELSCGRHKYTNSDDVDLYCLGRLIKEISKFTKRDDEEELIEGNYSYNCIETVDGMDCPEICLFGKPSKEKDEEENLQDIEVLKSKS